MHLEKAQQIGFTNVATVETSEIVFDSSLIDLCKQNVCGCYGRNYTCPPLCGEINTMIEKAKTYREMAVFQKIYPLEDSYDFEGMRDAGTDFGRLVIALGEALGDGNGERFILLGAGGCRSCETCGAISKTPCPNPERAYASLESYGIFVSELAKSCGMKYINGENTVTYFGGILYD